jgi:hypothetical protein
MLPICSVAVALGQIDLARRIDGSGVSLAAAVPMQNRAPDHALEASPIRGGRVSPHAGMRSLGWRWRWTVRIALPPVRGAWVTGRNGSARPRLWYNRSVPTDDWRYDGGESARWGLLPFALARSLVTWITGKDPIEERARRRMAKEQRANYERFSSLEKESFEMLGETASARIQRRRSPDQRTTQPEDGTPSATDP